MLIINFFKFLSNLKNSKIMIENVFIFLRNLANRIFANFQVEPYYEDLNDKDRELNDKDRELNLKKLIMKYEIQIKKENDKLEDRTIPSIAYSAFQKISDLNHVFIQIRESNSFSVNKKNILGASAVFPKPLDIKEKTISHIDLDLTNKINAINLGTVGCFNPFEKPENQENFTLKELLGKIYGDLNYVPVEVFGVDDTIKG